MVRYYEIRPNRDAWGTSLVIHAWMIALLLFVPTVRPPAEEPVSTPLELMLLDLGPAGDRVQGEDTRPAPRPAAVARVREVPPDRPVETLAEPRPAAVREARVQAAPPPAPAAAPVEQQVQEPDAAAIAAEESRRRAAEDARRREIEESGPTRTAYGGSGTSENPPPPGGAVGTGRGATGNLSGRRVLETFKPPYPAGAERRQSEGEVKVRIRVAASGRVEEAQLVRSSGDPDLDSVALAAFRRWRFSPLHAGAADQEGEVKMSFELQPQ